MWDAYRNCELTALPSHIWSESFKEQLESSSVCIWAYVEEFTQALTLLDWQTHVVMLSKVRWGISVGRGSSSCCAPVVLMKSCYISLTVITAAWRFPQQRDRKNANWFRMMSWREGSIENEREPRVKLDICDCKQMFDTTINVNHWHFINSIKLVLQLVLCPLVLMSLLPLLVLQLLLLRYYSSTWSCFPRIWSLKNRINPIMYSETGV